MHCTIIVHTLYGGTFIDRRSAPPLVGSTLDIDQSSAQSLIRRDKLGQRTYAGHRCRGTCDYTQLSGCIWLTHVIVSTVRVITEPTMERSG